MTPKTTLWPLEEHTKGKHAVLRHYLDRWFPILSSFAGRIAFIDGFSGPGRYTGGEPGSPLIALEVFKRHASRMKSEAVFLFIEDKKDRADHLTREIQALDLPSNCRWQVVRADFSTAMTNVLDKIPAGRLAPAFVMLDPFGVSGAPMTLVARLLRGGKAEVYVSFMYEYIDRFKATGEFERPLTELYGNEDWKGGLALPDGESKKAFFFGLYESRLREAGATQVIRFDMYRKGHLVYALFFASKHWRGADVMKEAIWKVAPFGDFEFHPARARQMRLFAPDTMALQTALRDRFRGKGWVTIEAIQEFVGSDATDFNTTQIKSMTLVPMEEAGSIDVDPATRKRRLTYPSGARIRFR